MPDLASRREHEDALTAAWLLWFREGRLDGISAELAAVFGAAARGLAGQQGWEVGDSRIDPEATAYGVSRASWLAAEVSGASRDMIARGVDPDLVFGTERAERISVTEVTRAISAGEMRSAAFAVATGLVGRLPARVWHTAADEDVCEECDPLDGQPEEVWRNTFPFGPPAHPHCRCWLEWR